MKDEHIYKSHNKTLLLYHLVFPAKYRKEVFIKEIEMRTPLLMPLSITLTTTAPTEPLWSTVAVLDFILPAPDLSVFED